MTIFYHLAEYSHSGSDEINSTIYSYTLQKFYYMKF